MARFTEIFGTARPVIGMVHLGALPGASLHDAAAGLGGLVAACCASRGGR